MALVKILKVGESINIGDLVEVKVTSIDRETVGLEFTPDDEKRPLTAVYQKKSRIDVIPNLVNIVVHTKLSQVNSACLSIAAPREIAIKQMEKLSND